MKNNLSSTILTLCSAVIVVATMFVTLPNTKDKVILISSNLHVKNTLITKKKYGKIVIRHKKPIENPLYKRLSKCTLKLLSVNNDGTVFNTFSGVYITTNIILTVNHGIEGMSHFYIIGGLNNTIYRLNILKVDKKHDLALLENPVGEHSFVDINSNFPNIGCKIFSISSPDGLKNTFLWGYISNNIDFVDLKTKTINTDQAMVSFSVLPGSSGGPVYDMDGDLVGIIDAVYTVFKHDGNSKSLVWWNTMIIKSDAVLKFIRE